MLIILAGVAINLTLGNNGIFNKAKYAKSEYLNSKGEEETQISQTTNSIDEYVDTMRFQSSYSRTLLWSGEKFETGEITLNDTIDNYDMITVVAQYRPWANYNNQTFSTNIYKEDYTIDYNNGSNARFVIDCSGGSEQRRIVFNICENKLTINTISYSQLVRVYGINH